MLEIIARAWQAEAERYRQEHDPWECPSCHCLFERPGFDHARCGSPAIGDTRACPDCGRPQHYTGHENGWAHDALIDTWECADPRADRCSLPMPHTHGGIAP